MGEKYHLYRKFSETKDGKKTGLWYYWYWDQGKRIRRAAGFNGRASELKRVAQNFIDHLSAVDAAGPQSEPAPITAPVRRPPSYGAPRTFGPFAETLYQPGAQHLKREATLANGHEITEETRLGHRSRLNIYLIPRWGSSSWAVFEQDGFADDFIDWLVDLERIPMHKAGTPTPEPVPISNSTRNAIIETMGIALREAKRSRYIRIVPEFDRFTRGSKHQDTLTDEELAKLFPEDRDELEKIWQLDDGRDHGTGILFGAMCCLGVSAGLRSGELRAVSADQIIRRKLPNGEMFYGLIVDKALSSKQKIVGLKKATKEDLRVRAVVLTEKTIKILDMFLATVPPRESFLFLHRGEPIRKETLGRRWAAGLRQAEISLAGRRMTPHAMRYTFNTRMRMLLSEKTLQEAIGHKDEEMTIHYDRPHMIERLMQLTDQRGAFNKFWDGTRTP
ncbi:MAG: tyrosine-type recombinase/integrase [Spirochaetales bacterium]